MRGRGKKKTILEGELKKKPPHFGVWGLKTIFGGGGAKEKDTIFGN